MYWEWRQGGCVSGEEPGLLSFSSIVINQFQFHLGLFIAQVSHRHNAPKLLFFASRSKAPNVSGLFGA